MTCVRFNDNMFEKEQKLDGKKKTAQYVCIAIGSRDRSLSVWLTSLKRPLFVIHDVFESSILDLAWSKDGMVLLACSMDGSVAAVVLNEDELGEEFLHFLFLVASHLNQSRRLQNYLQARPCPKSRRLHV